MQRLLELAILESFERVKLLVSAFPQLSDITKGCVGVRVGGGGATLPHLWKNCRLHRIFVGFLSIFAHIFRSFVDFLSFCRLFSCFC